MAGMATHFRETQQLIMFAIVAFQHIFHAQTHSKDDVKCQKAHHIILFDTCIHAIIYSVFVFFPCNYELGFKEDDHNKLPQ